MSQYFSHTEDVVSLGWTPMIVSSGSILSIMTVTTFSWSFRTPNGDTAPCSMPRKRCSLSSEARPSFFAPTFSPISLKSVCRSSGTQSKKCFFPSYYKVVVFIVPLQGLYPALLGDLPLQGQDRRDYGHGGCSRSWLCGL